jgi:hypothetical protein
MKHNDRLDSLIYANLTVEQTKAWKIAHEYSISFGMAMFICRKESERFEELFYYNDDKIIQTVLTACIAEEWGEGVAIVEQEIARRGLHVEDNEGRFEL